MEKRKFAGTMMLNVEEKPAYRKLYASSLVSVSEYCCSSHKSGPAHEEQSENNSIVLMRYGAFVKHIGKRRVTADVNQAVFFSKNSVYRVSHPSDCGDRGTFFLVAPQTLNEMIREFDPGVDERPEQPFDFVTGLCGTQLFRRHRELIDRLAREVEEPLNSLWADETLLQWIADVLKSAFDRHSQPVRARRTNTKNDHAEKAEAAKAFLAERLSEQVTLTNVARAVAASPFNFARLFRQHTGIPVHRYLTLLRLRTSIERLPESENDLTGLALDLGFSSHSHFTDVFRREFGNTPSEMRKIATSSKLREMSKNLIV
jgi:AraC-like DNA-binding protein